MPPLPARMGRGGGGTSFITAVRMDLAGYRITTEPYYRPVGDEIALFEAAYAARMPMMLKGPTGCGKTRFIEHIAWRLGRPLLTAACREDRAACGLVGRVRLGAEGTVWH